MSFFENTRKPTGLGGKVMVSMMNLGHRALADWGFPFLDIAADAAVKNSSSAAEPTLKSC